MPKGKSAKYTIIVPVDYEGRYERVMDAAYQKINDSVKGIINPHVTGPHQQGHHRVKHIVWIAPESPQADSIAKQIGSEIADAANIQALTVLKEGGSGIHSWTMRSKAFSLNRKKKAAG